MQPSLHLHFGEDGFSEQNGRGSLSGGGGETKFCLGFTSKLQRRPQRHGRLTQAGVASVYVGEPEAQVAFAEEAPKRVHALPAARTQTATASRRALVDVCGDERMTAKHQNLQLLQTDAD